MVHFGIGWQYGYASYYLFSSGSSGLEFQRAVMEGAPVAVSVQDGLKTVVIGLAAEQSFHARRAIEVDALSLT